MIAVCSEAERLANQSRASRVEERDVVSDIIVRFFHLP